MDKICCFTTTFHVDGRYWFRIFWKHFHRVLLFTRIIRWTKMLIKGVRQYLSFHPFTHFLFIYTKVRRVPRWCRHHTLRQCLCGTKHMLHTRTMPSLHEDETIKTIPNGHEMMVSSFKSYRSLEQDTLLVTQQK